MPALLDIVGKRFLGFLIALIGGFLAAHFITDGVQLEHFYSFVTTIFGVYVAGQSSTDAVAFFKGLKSMVTR